MDEGLRRLFRLKEGFQRQISNIEGGKMAEIEKFRGAIIGASCGDALGYPLQNLSVARIKHRFGPFGLRTLVGDPKTERKHLFLTTHRHSWQQSTGYSGRMPRSSIS